MKEYCDVTLHKMLKKCKTNITTKNDSNLVDSKGYIYLFEIKRSYGTINNLSVGTYATKKYKYEIKMNECKGFVLL